MSFTRTNVHCLLVKILYQHLNNSTWSIGSLSLWRAPTMLVSCYHGSGKVSITRNNVHYKKECPLRELMFILHRFSYQHLNHLINPPFILGATDLNAVLKYFIAKIKDGKSFSVNNGNDTVGSTFAECQ